MNGNGFVAWLLRSPLHGVLSGNTMLISVQGRKSGREITLPVNYIRVGNEIWVVSQRDRKWWRNLTGGSAVRLLVQGHEMMALAQTVLDEAQLAEMLAKYLRQIPLAAKAMAVKKVGDRWDPADLRRAAKARVMVVLLQAV